MRALGDRRESGHRRHIFPKLCFIRSMNGIHISTNALPLK